MRIALVLLAASATSAAAAPLSPLWRAPKSCPHVMARTPDAVLVFDDKKQRLIRLDARTGKPTTVKLPRLAGTSLEQFVVVTAGGAVVMRVPKELVAIDATSGKALWRKKLPKKLDWGLEGIAAGDDVIVQWSDGKQAVIERIEVATGNAKWHLEPKGFASGRWLGGSALHPVAIDQHKDATGLAWTIVGLDPADGHTVWTAQLADAKASYSSPYTAGDDVAVEIEDRLVLIDGATGKTATAPLKASAVVGFGGRAYTTSDHLLAAFDVKTAKQLWTQPMLAWSPLAYLATATTVYVEDADLLREVDAATGKTVATYGKGDSPFTHPWTAVPMMTICDGTTLVALDPSAPPEAEQTVTVDATVSCQYCEQPIEVKVGDVRAKPDAKGHVTLTAKVRGKTAFMWLYNNEWQLERALDPAKHTFKLGDVELQPPPEGD